MMKSLDGQTDNDLMNCNTVESNNAYKKDCKVHVRHPGNGYLDKVIVAPNMPKLAEGGEYWSRAGT